MHKTSRRALLYARRSRQETASWDLSVTSCSLNTMKKNATAMQYELMSAERHWERERTTQIESRSTRSLNSMPALFASRNDAGTND